MFDSVKEYFSEHPKDAINAASAGIGLVALVMAVRGAKSTAAADAIKAVSHDGAFLHVPPIESVAGARVLVSSGPAFEGHGKQIAALLRKPGSSPYAAAEEPILGRSKQVAALLRPQRVLAEPVEHAATPTRIAAMLRDPGVETVPYRLIGR